MPDFKPGEIVNITVEGARVRSVRREFGDGPWHLSCSVGEYVLTVPLSEVTVERGDPEWWPPRPGDVLRHTETGRLWFGVAHSSNLCFYASNADCMDPQQSWEQRHLLTLVHREDEQDGGRSDG